METLRATKIDAVRRQIMTALQLYFTDGDIVSVHTLAAAAFELTKSICDADGNRLDALSSYVDVLIRPEYKKLFWYTLSETENFFKGLERNPPETHEFRPDQTENLLFFAVCQYQNVTADYPPLIRIFSAWYMIHHPEVFITPPELSRLGKELFPFEDKTLFYRIVLPLIQSFQT
ncbi:MAG: hypothetical protein JXD19_01125 [Deltaproteobacteria bacterium]|nr:hypothetical protein [Deltaproteobacteria bacterium]